VLAQVVRDGQAAYTLNADFQAQLRHAYSTGWACWRCSEARPCRLAGLPHRCSPAACCWGVVR
jgi:hypothetical protein